MLLGLVEFGGVGKAEAEDELVVFLWDGTKLLPGPVSWLGSGAVKGSRTYFDAYDCVSGRWLGFIE